MVVEHGAQRRNQGRIVLQRLTHAHHHHVGDDTLIGLDVLAQKVLGKPQLGEDLASGEVAAETLVTGRTEPATYRTTRLRRNAQCSPVVLGNEDCRDFE